LGRDRFFRLLLVAAVLNLATSMIHPITPAWIAERKLDDAMFGMMFAAMAAGGFLAGPLWGRLADRRGRLPAMALGAVGYGAAQLAFGYLHNPVAILAMRFLGGVMVMGANAGLMASAIDLTDDRSRAARLAQYAAAVSVAAALGYFSGGLLGVWSVMGTFYVQAAALLLSAALMMGLLGETRPAVAAEGQGTADRTPAKGRAPRRATMATALFFAGVVAAQFGSAGYDNTFNYYLSNALGYPSSVNGIVKAATGLMGLLANLTINMWAARRFRPDRSLAAMLAACAATLALVPSMRGAAAFFATNIAFYLFNSMYMPMQQALAARDRGAGAGAISGLFNSARNLGMVAGALAAGLAYRVGPALAFYHQAIGFAAAAALTYLSFRRGADIMERRDNHVV